MCGPDAQVENVEHIRVVPNKENPQGRASLAWGQSLCRSERDESLAPKSIQASEAQQASEQGYAERGQ
jgi:hypothetical protein